MDDGYDNVDENEGGNGNDRGDTDDNGDIFAYLQYRLSSFSDHIVAVSMLMFYQY